ncbi:MAG: hypothetical protein Q8920_11155 [Bacillota bacterium]|nr:hypothetical protein [Bacillota bacterium]
MRKFIALAFIPVLILHLLFLALWIFDKTTATLPETLTDVLFVPIYLISINYIFKRKINGKLLGINFFIILIASILGDFLHYLNWGLTTGYLTKPDSGTLTLIRSIIVINIITILVANLVLQRILLKREKSKVNLE